MVISETEDHETHHISKLPASNIKANLNSFNSNLIEQNHKNPFTKMQRSKYSAQHVSSIDKTVRYDSFEKPDGPLKKD